MKRIGLAFTLIAFLVLTVVAVGQHGYLGIFTQQFEQVGGIQVLVDLVIALSLFLVWMWNDAKAAGRNPLPWLLLTLATGSIGALVYLLVYKSANERVPQAGSIK
jgi:hypothetical protein